MNSSYNRIEHVLNEDRTYDDWESDYNDDSQWRDLTLDDLITNNVGETDNIQSESNANPSFVAVKWIHKQMPIVIPARSFMNFLDENKLDEVDNNTIYFDLQEHPTREYYIIDINNDTNIQENTYIIQPKRTITQEEVFTNGRRFAVDKPKPPNQQGGKRKSRKSRKSKKSKKSQKSQKSRKYRK
jgi:hypothetical protein